MKQQSLTAKLTGAVKRPVQCLVRRPSTHSLDVAPQLQRLLGSTCVTGSWDC
jgi:hypothetical protein